MATYADLDSWVNRAAELWRSLATASAPARVPTAAELTAAEQLAVDLNGLGLLDGDAAAIADSDRGTVRQLGDALAALASRAKRTANGLRPADAGT